MARVAVVGLPSNATSVALAAAWRGLGLDARLLGGAAARRLLRPGDVALGRLDVRRALDGVEPGLLDLLLLERGGVRVLNSAASLLAVHDKARTARLLDAAGVPHPPTEVLRRPDEPLPFPPPLVVKPRFGSWGLDVHRCENERDARELLASLGGRPWFRRGGALVQPLLSEARSDLRVVVAGGTVLGAVRREAAPGEWRTNVSLGGTRTRIEPDVAERALALAAARAVGCDLVGVDLLPLPGGGRVVVELNGAVDFDERYVPPGVDVYARAARALGLPAVEGAAEAPGFRALARA